GPVDVEPPGDRRRISRRQLGPRLVEDAEGGPGARLGGGLLTRLDPEALAEVARADAGRIESLDEPEDCLDLRHAHAEPARDVDERLAEVAVVVDVFDQVVADRRHPGRGDQTPLLLEVSPKRPGRADRRG